MRRIMRHSRKIPTRFSTGPSRVRPSLNPVDSKAGSADVKQHAHIPLSAILLIVVASGCFSAVAVTVKHLSQRYPVLLLVWARWGVQALVLLALMGPRMRLDLVRNVPLRPHLEPVVLA